MQGSSVMVNSKPKRYLKTQASMTILKRYRTQAWPYCDLHELGILLAPRPAGVVAPTEPAAISDDEAARLAGLRHKGGRPGQGGRGSKTIKELGKPKDANGKIEIPVKFDGEEKWVTAEFYPQQHRSGLRAQSSERHTGGGVGSSETFATANTILFMVRNVEGAKKVEGLLLAEGLRRGFGDGVIKYPNGTEVFYYYSKATLIKQLGLS